ncbi:MAG: hypothetical protein LBL54_00345 [Clostridiales Family XIII bacterium]|jgi:hypothetical protein|nr:hypothetical protein [Clostridiales Family XIII bacterium]
MARYGTLKRNIKRNIKPWSADEAAKARGDIVVASKIFAVFLALSLAGAFALPAAKVIFSIPDLYSFDLGRTQVIKESEIAAEKAEIEAYNDNIAEMISSFMMHKTDNFQIESDEGDGDGSAESAANPEGAESLGSTEGAASAADSENSESAEDAENAESPISLVPIFTANDGKVMTTLRSFLDNIFIIGLTSLAVFISMCVILVRWNRPRELRRGFTGGFVLYGIFICFFAAAVVFKWPYVMAIWTDVIGARFTPADMTPKLFQGGLFLTSWIAVAVVTLVIMLVLTSVISRLAKHERMFRRK